MVHEDTLIAFFFAGGVGVFAIKTSVHAEGFITLREHEHIVQPFTRQESGSEVCFYRWYWRDERDVEELIIQIRWTMIG